MYVAKAAPAQPPLPLAEANGNYRGIISSSYFLLDEKVTKNQGKPMLPPALPNRKPHGDVSDLERSEQHSFPYHSWACRILSSYGQSSNAFQIERKRPRSWG
jgi:hypothetical protein